MTTGDFETEVSASRGGMGAAWLWISFAVILFLGSAFSIAVYAENPDLTILEAIAGGFAGVAALIIGLFAGAIGLVVGLIGAALGIVVAGGAVATTLFVIGSPIIAIVLIALMMRRPKSCPDPSVHEV